MKITKSVFRILKITLGITGRVCTSSLVPLLSLLLILPVLGAQAAVVFTTLYSFNLINDGANPSAALVQGSDGYFYGTTWDGGTNGWGTVFKISPNGALTSLYSFTSGTDGSLPWAGLVQGGDGSFYGATESGGTNDAGAVFRISPNGELSSLHSFSRTNDGASPFGGLVQGSDGYFYGTTYNGGVYTSQSSGGYGTVFRINTNGVLTTLYSFGSITNASGEAPDGAYPQAALVQGSDGNFYGTTGNGGVYTNQYGLSLPRGYGTVFKITTNGALTSLYSFTGTNDGAYPNGLVQGTDGYFYGTTYRGGTNNAGTVFRINTNGVLTTLYSFGSITNASGEAPDGANPQAALVQGSDGNFYGTTQRGGSTNYVDFIETYGYGTVFKISPNGTLTTLYSFGSVLDTNGVSLDGRLPLAALVQGSDGCFYGTTQQGGAYGSAYNGYGTVFRLTIVPQPQLTIIPSGPYVILTWPTNYAGFTLQSTTNLGSSVLWTTNSSSPVVICGQNVVVNDISGRQHFYRLSQRLP